MDCAPRRAGLASLSMVDAETILPETVDRDRARQVSDL
jgi:hypothetical protein